MILCRCCVPLLGSVPAYYREVFEAICCRTDERVQVEVFQRLLQTTDLSKAVLGQVRCSYFTLGESYAASGEKREIKLTAAVVTEFQFKALFCVDLIVKAIRFGFFNANFIEQCKCCEFAKSVLCLWNI